MTLREKIVKLLSNGWGNSYSDFGEAADKILNLIEKELPKKNKEDFLKDITHADEELAIVQAIAMRIGFDSAIELIKTKLREGCR